MHRHCHPLFRLFRRLFHCGCCLALTAFVAPPADACPVAVGLPGIAYTVAAPQAYAYAAPAVAAPQYAAAAPTYSAPAPQAAEAVYEVPADPQPPRATIQVQVGTTYSLPVTAYYAPQTTLLAAPVGYVQGYGSVRFVQASVSEGRFVDRFGVPHRFRFFDGRALERASARRSGGTQVNVSRVHR